MNIGGEAITISNSQMLYYILMSTTGKEEDIMTGKPESLMATLENLHQSTDNEVRTACKEHYLILSALHFRLLEYDQAKYCLTKYHSLSPEEVLQGDLLAIELGMSIVSGDREEEQRLQALAREEGAFDDPSFANFITQMKAMATFRKPEGQS